MLQLFRKVAAGFVWSLVALTALLSTAGAAPPSNTTTIRNSFSQRDYLVEQQSWDYINDLTANGLEGMVPGTSTCGYVFPSSPLGYTPVVNPACGTADPVMWDADDTAWWAGFGDLVVGEQILLTQPLYLDTDSHLIVVNGNSRNGTVVVKMSIPEINWSVTVPAGVTACYIVPYLPYSELPSISGSNGGKALRATVTWSLTTPKRAGKAALYGKVGYGSGNNQIGYGCSVIPVPRIPA